MENADITHVVVTVDHDGNYKYRTYTMKKSKNFIFRFLLLAVFSTGASASLVTFDNLNLTPTVGNTFTVDILADFSGVGEATLGGSIDIFYDENVLSFQSFSFLSNTLSLDSFLSRTPDDQPGELEGLAFSNGTFAGISTAGIVGTITFTAISIGDFDITIADSDLLAAGGPFRDLDNNIMTVGFGSSNVVVSAVPVPAAAWFFGSALFGLFAVRRRS